MHEFGNTGDDGADRRQPEVQSMGTTTPPSPCWRRIPTYKHTIHLPVNDRCGVLNAAIWTRQDVVVSLQWKTLTHYAHPIHPTDDGGLWSAFKEKALKYKTVATTATETTDEVVVNETKNNGFIIFLSLDIQLCSASAERGFSEKWFARGTRNVVRPPQGRERVLFTFFKQHPFLLAREGFPRQM